MAEIGAWFSDGGAPTGAFVDRMAAAIAADIDFHIDGRLAALSDEFKRLWPNEIGKAHVEVVTAGPEGAEVRAAATVERTASDLSRDAYVDALADFLEDLAASRAAIDGAAPPPTAKFGNATAKLLRDHVAGGGAAEFVGPNGRRETFGSARR